MAQALAFPGLVTGGRLPAEVSAKIAAALRGFEGKRVIVTLKEQKRPRSLNQNSFYHGPFIQAFQQCLLDCGQRVSAEDIHAGLRDAHAKNSYTIILPGDVPFRVPPSTARLTTADFEGFLEEIRAEYAAKFGWQLPFPNESESTNQGGAT